MNRNSDKTLQYPWLLGFITLFDRIAPIVGSDPMLAIQNALTAWTESQAPDFCDGCDIDFFLRLTCGAALKENDPMDDYDSMGDDDAVIAVGLHNPAFFYIGPILTELENYFPGLGHRILRALDCCPLEIYTPASVEQSMDYRWDEWNERDEIEDDDPDFGGYTRKSYELAIPDWARCDTEVKPYDGELPEKLGPLLTELESLNKEYWQSRELNKVAIRMPMGGVTGICLMWEKNDDDDFIKHVWDDDIEYAQQMGTEIFISAFFCVDFETEKNPENILTATGNFLRAGGAAVRLLYALDQIEKNKEVKR